MQFEAEAEVGNTGGVFDAACDFGEESVVTGSPAEIGAAVPGFLTSLTTEACEAMRYGTGDFFVRVVIRPAVGEAGPPPYPRTA